MAFRVNRELFLAALNQVTPGLSVREFIDQSSCFVFDRGWVETFNDEICCKMNLKKLGMSEAFEGAISARDLLDYLTVLGDDEIELVPGKGELIVKTGRKRAQFKMKNEILLPTDQVVQPSEWRDIPSPKEFKSAIQKVIGVTGNDAEEFLTVCVNVTPTWLEACDLKQSSRYMIDTPIDNSFLLRAKSMAHLVPLEMIKVGEADSWVHFKLSNMQMSIRRHLEDYPSDKITKQIADFRGSPGELPVGASEASKLAGIFTKEDKDNNKVTVFLTDGKMVVRGDGVRGWSEVDLDMATYRGPDVKFRITPTMLEQLVREYRDVKVEIAPTKLRVTGENWTYITVLGRVEEKEPEPIKVPAEEPPQENTDEGDGDDGS